MSNQTQTTPFFNLTVEELVNTTWLELTSKHNVTKMKARKIREFLSENALVLKKSSKEDISELTLRQLVDIVRLASGSKQEINCADLANKGVNNLESVTKSLKDIAASDPVHKNKRAGYTRKEIFSTDEYSHLFKEFLYAE